MFFIILKDRDGKYFSLENQDTYFRRFGGEIRMLGIHRHIMQS